MIEDRWLDWLAIGTSLLCLVHCLALPVVIAALPTVGLSSRGDATHLVLLALAVPVSLWALGRGRVAGGVPIAVGVSGLGLMALAVFGLAGLPDERWLTVAGVVLVAIAHLMRWRGIHRGHGHRFGR